MKLNGDLWLVIFMEQAPTYPYIIHNLRQTFYKKNYFNDPKSSRNSENIKRQLAGFEKQFVSLHH
jgi:hypothetical protein